MKDLCVSGTAAVSSALDPSAPYLRVPGIGDTALCTQQFPPCWLGSNFQNESTEEKTTDQAIAHSIEGAAGSQYRSMVMKKLVVAAGIVAGLAFGAAAFAQTEPTIPVIVKDVTSPYWRAVLAGARKAGKDFGVNVVGLGPQSEADTNGQIGILAKAVASNPAAIVIAPAEYAALGKPIDEAAKKVKIIGIESAADTKAMTSLLATDNLNAGRIAADALAVAITKS